MYSILSLLNRVFPASSVYAHCDIPCGIYTTEPMQTAAATVVKMAEKIQEADAANAHDISRFTAVKEEHAQICKEQMLILWTDYFKEEHLEAFPELHNTFWKATKLCSKVKQEGSIESAQELEKAVSEISETFSATKK